jgi:catechol 2,3-dioxygenase-like lactoylglutathione lyase family enzyme
MSDIPQLCLGHVGFYVRDMPRMIEFYTKVLGLVLTDTGTLSGGAGQIAFLSRTPEEHHQVALISGRPDPDGATTMNQVSFRVPTLTDLKKLHARVADAGVRELTPRTHGNAWSLYFLDPEGNRIELYTGTPWHVAQPYGKPYDITASEAEIHTATQALIKDDPTYCPAETWSRRIAPAMA